ncbi:2-dehydro-3-deoxygalactonokinase [Paremcibacter congregatus]|uniref:2-dehydro-3-deoxygalactonokinase n=1 Tax=Paremcibacter congregatus TaxID=2043170 RepID=UPI003A957FF3
MTHHYICADWGSSNLRAYLVDDTGAVLEQRSLNQGILVCKGNFKATIHRLCHGWLLNFPQAPLYLCGMIGSREGWVDAGYLDTPADITRLAERLVAVPGLDHPAWIVPGIRHYSENRKSVDLMRGEETQILGAMQRHDVKNGIFVLPGTHSKWSDIQDGHLTRFKTYMTGEMFNIIKEHSILHYSIDDTVPTLNNAFFEGVTQAVNGSSLLNQIFMVRATDVMALKPRNEQSSYLSGILIGQEIHHALTSYGGKPIYLIGSGSLATLYHGALKHLEYDAEQISGDIAARLGLYSLTTQGRTL